LTILLSLGSAPPQATAAERQVRITGSVANVRPQASMQGQPLFQVKSGEVLQLLDVAGDWYHVEASGGRQGYVYKGLAEIIDAHPPAAAAAPAAVTTAAPAQAPVAIDHKAIGCIVAEQHPKLDACFKPEANLGRAEIHFRALDTDPWYAVPLTPAGDCRTALLPKPLKTTKQIEYYVDAIDRSLTELEQPSDSPAGAYHVRVVKKQGDCDNMKMMAMSMPTAASPITVSVVRDAAGKALDAATKKELGSRLALSGFDKHGVVGPESDAGSGAGHAAAASADAAAPGSASGSAPADSPAAGGSSSGGKGGKHSHTLLYAGGAALGVIGIVAAVAGGGGSSSSSSSNSNSSSSNTNSGGSSSPSTCSASQLAAGSGGALVAVGPDEVCTNFFSCGNHNVRACESSVCEISNCRVFYELDFGLQITCTATNCADPNAIATCVRTAVVAVASACQ
jgi:hypothetical protein